MVMAAQDNGFQRVFVPEGNAARAVVDGIDVIAVSSVASLMGHLSGEKILSPAHPEIFRIFICQMKRLPIFGCLRTGSRRRLWRSRRSAQHTDDGSRVRERACWHGGSVHTSRYDTDEALEATKIHSIAGMLPGGSGL